MTTSSNHASTAPSQRRLSSLEGCLWLAILASCLAAFLFAKGGTLSQIAQMEPQGRLWWAWIAGCYLVLGLLALLVFSGLARLLRRPRLAQLTLGATALVFLATALVANRPALANLLGGSSDSSAGWIPLAALLLSCLGLFAPAAGMAWSRPWVFRLLATSAAGFCFFALTPSGDPHDSFPALDLTGAGSGTGERILVIGLDGADWRYLDSLIEQGELPHLASLRDNGVWGDLETLRPTRSAAIWTTVVTGRHPRDHGVLNNTVERLRGSLHRLPQPLPIPRALGLARLVKALRRAGRIVDSPVASFDRTVPAFWNIATALGSPVDFVNWWASWPAEAVLGRMVSDRAYFWREAAKGHELDGGHVTFPQQLHRELADLIVRPDQVTYEDALKFMSVSRDEFAQMMAAPYVHHRLTSEFKYFYSMHATNLRLARHLLGSRADQRLEAADLFVIFRLIDQACHTALAYSELVDDHLKSSPQEREKYGRVVSEAYRAADRAVGELVEAFGPGNLVILSDHGFKLNRPRSPRRYYGHFGSSPPDGIFIAAGEAFARGRIEGVSVYHLMPILLALKGWPVADDFGAPVPAEVFAKSFLERNPLGSIPSYGSLRVTLPEDTSLVAEEEMVERLRALGYLD